MQGEQAASYTHEYEYSMEFSKQTLVLYSLLVGIFQMILVLNLFVRV